LFEIDFGRGSRHDPKLLKPSRPLFFNPDW